MKIRAIGAAALLALSLTACGASDDDKAADALAAGMMDEAGEELALDQEQADCVGQGMVEKVGTDQLVEYGILNKDLEYGELEVGGIKMSEADAAATADVFVDCVGTDFVGNLLQTEASALPDAARECIEEKLTDDVMRELLTASFEGDQVAAAKAMSPLMACTMPGQ